MMSASKVRKLDCLRNTVCQEAFKTTELCLFWCPVLFLVALVLSRFSVMVSPASHCPPSFFVLKIPYNATLTLTMSSNSNMCV